MISKSHALSVTLSQEITKLLAIINYLILNVTTKLGYPSCRSRSKISTGTEMLAMA